MPFFRAFALFYVAVLVLVTNVAASIGYMVIFGHLIAPGHDAKFYEDHIQVAGPYCSIVAGVPIMFFAGWWVAGWWHRTLNYKGAFLVWLIYTLIDLTILLFIGLTLEVSLLFVVSFATKLVAVLWGAWMRLHRRAKSKDGPQHAATIE